MVLLELLFFDDAVDGPYGEGLLHFVDGADEEEEYSYDANGNVTSDLNKNIARIDYNCLNLPTMIRFGDGSKYMSMKYDAAGRLLRRTTRVPFKDIAVSGKLQQVTAKADLSALSSRLIARNGAASAAGTAGSSSGSSASPSLAPSTTLQGTPSSVSSSVVPAISGKVSMRTFGMTDYDYCGNVEYINDKAVLYHSEGYVTFDKNQQPEFHYYLKDHLGNIHVVFNERDSVEQVTHYYPFGGSFGDGVGSSVQDYLYSGKELTRFNALNWYNYGARWYDPAILRWNGVDKLAEKYKPVSPYSFCLNNPVNIVDRDGMKPDSLSAALMSKLAYGYDKEAYNELINQGWSFCSHHASASGFKYNIYKKKKSDNSYEYTCAYAGTDADSGVGDFLKDAANDVINYVGGIAPQYAEAISTSLKISGESELTFVGHSLGGGLAALSSMVTGKDAITFNAASVTGLLKVAGQAISSFRGGVITQYRSVGSNFLSGDPVNTFQNLTHRPSQGKVIPVKVGKNFSHGIQDIINAFYRNR